MNWEALQKEYDAIAEKLAAGNLDNRTRATLQKKASQYSTVLSKHQEILDLEVSIADLNSLKEDDPELSSLYEEEIAEQSAALQEAQMSLDTLLYPGDERDTRSVFLEIRAGAGGQEAALFAADLFKMYSLYAQTKNWKISIVDASQTDIGGYKELIVFIKGKNVYKHFKYESGVHRVQRVPKTETQGRVHTSTVTVAILPEAEEVDVDINPSDLRIDVFRSSGPGGQSVNTTDSAVRITHVPTGVVVSCQDERSQIKNKAKAMKILQARIYEAERARKEAELSAKRREQIGAGMRAEKIRTYNFPQNRVSDHRTNVTLKKLDLFMQGELDDILLPLMKWGLDERKKRGGLLLAT